jgi:hypothetical protein
MRTSIRVAAVASVLALAASAQAASFSLTSGTIHAQASATPSGLNGGSSATVNSTPADIILGGGTNGGHLVADAQTTFGNTGDAHGSFTSDGSFFPTGAGATLSGASQGNAGLPGSFGSAVGSGSVDIFFNLDAQTLVQFNEFGNADLSNYFSGSFVLKQGPTTIQSLNGGDHLFTQVLNPGSYELIASADAHPRVGTGGSGSQSFSVSVVPEPVSSSLVLIAVFGTLRLRRRIA